MTAVTKWTKAPCFRLRCVGCYLDLVLPLSPWRNHKSHDFPDDFTRHIRSRVLSSRNFAQVRLCLAEFHDIELSQHCISFFATASCILSFLSLHQFSTKMLRLTCSHFAAQDWQALDSLGLRHPKSLTCYSDAHD